MRVLRYLITLFCLVLAQTTAAESTANFKLEGFTESVIIVKDAKPLKRMMTQVGGWHVVDQPKVDERLKTLWQLPDKAQIRQVLLANKGEARGYIRLIEIDNVEQAIIRSNTQSWDTGGIFDLNMRVIDLNKKHKELMNMGWFSTSDPVSFTFGPFEVNEWIVKNADGVAFALIERLKPTLEGWPNLKQFSRVFNSTQVVKDIEKSLPFYTDILGFETYLEHKGASKSAGPNVLGLPVDLTTQIERSVYILHPQGINEGSIELLQFHGAQGRDLSHLAKPPNIGIVTVRFPVDNLTALKRKLIENDIKIVSQSEMLLPPYGLVDMLAVQTPDNNWLEFYQKL